MSQKLSLRDPAHSGFDFTAAMRALCADATQRLVELSHVQLDLVAISFAQSRKPVLHGLQASLTPLRFEGGSRYGRHRGRRVTVQKLCDVRGRELLYILNFYLPRFMDLGFREKLVTVFHELWHISPHFNGDIRRHQGRCYAHSASQSAYDAGMERLVDRYLALMPPASLFEFLRSNFRRLEVRYGHVYGLKIQRPKLISV